MGRGGVHISDFTASRRQSQDRGVHPSLRKRLDCRASPTSDEVTLASAPLAFRQETRITLTVAATFKTKRWRVGRGTTA